MRSQVIKQHADKVTLHTDAASLAAPADAPTAGATGDVRGWRSGAYAPRDASIAIDASAGVTITGPVDLLGYDSSDAKWRVCARLAEGRDIVMTAVIGFEEKVFDVGTFEHLQLYAPGGVSGGNVTVSAKPFEDMGR